MTDQAADRIASALEAIAKGQAQLIVEIVTLTNALTPKADAPKADDEATSSITSNEAQPG